MFTTTCSACQGMRTVSPYDDSPCLECTPELTPDPSCGTTGCERHDGECQNNWGEGF
jgi:hypothetical protein